MMGISYTGVIRTHPEHRKRRPVIVWTGLRPFHLFLWAHIAYPVSLRKGASVAFGMENIMKERRSAGIAGSMSRNHCVLNGLCCQKCWMLNSSENVCQVYNF